MEQKNGGTIDFEKALFQKRVERTDKNIEITAQILAERYADDPVAGAKRIVTKLRNSNEFTEDERAAFAVATVLALQKLVSKEEVERFVHDMKLGKEFVRVEKKRDELYPRKNGHKLDSSFRSAEGYLEDYCDEYQDEVNEVMAEDEQDYYKSIGLSDDDIWEMAAHETDDWNDILD